MSKASRKVSLSAAHIPRLPREGVEIIEKADGSADIIVRGPLARKMIEIAKGRGVTTRQVFEDAIKGHLNHLATLKILMATTEVLKGIGDMAAILLRNESEIPEEYRWLEY